MWEKLYAKLRIVTFPGHRTLRKPDIAALDRCELQLGLKLPRSYRDYASVFGAGELGCYARIYVPGLAGDVDFDIEECNKGREKTDALFRDELGCDNTIARLIFFGSSFMGDMFAWDPAKISDDGFEYAIIGIPRHPEKLIPLAATFPEFIDSVLFGPGFPQMFAGVDVLGEDRLEFIPAVEFREGLV